MQNNIRVVRARRGYTQRQLAEKLGVGVPQVSRWESGQVDLPSSRVAALAAALDVAVEEIIGDLSSYALQPSSKPFAMEGASATRMPEDLPIYGTALGAAREIDGEAIEQTTLNRAEVIQYAKRPVLLNGNASAYGLYVAGSSMDPRYRDGEMLLVDPKGRIRGGDDVVVYLRARDQEADDGETARAALVKRLIRRSAGYLELEQYSPPKVFRIEAENVLRVDRVIPWQELIS